jgi:hypothetical protein
MDFAVNAKRFIVFLSKLWDFMCDTFSDMVFLSTYR